MRKYYILGITLAVVGAIYSGLAQEWLGVVWAICAAVGCWVAGNLQSKLDITHQRFVDLAKDWLKEVKQ